MGWGVGKKERLKERGNGSRGEQKNDPSEERNGEGKRGVGDIGRGGDREG